jgi:hypothetical protein
MESVKVFVETRWFVRCPNKDCREPHDVDAYESSEIECRCGTKFKYDNGSPRNAEAV